LYLFDYYRMWRATELRSDLLITLAHILRVEIRGIEVSKITDLRIRTGLNSKTLAGRL
jgi:hypothetical protein